jgi:uncharacterized protein (DUF488 family)
MSISAPALWTVGHSNMECGEFVSNLQRHDIEVVADVRSWPRSRYAPWFDRGPLADALRSAGISYIWMGPDLGGRPDDPAVYLPDGRVRYDRVAATVTFQKGMCRLRRGMERVRVAIMCSEEDPEHCHRRLLVARVLAAEDVAVHHIRRSGDVEPESGFVSHAGLFGDEELPWTSTASVSQGRRPKASLAD